VLVVNAGSSSLKLALVVDGVTRAWRTVAHWAGADDVAPLVSFAARAEGVDAVGHRFVHGGPRFAAPVVLDADSMDYLRSLVPLAPLHQPRGLAGVAAAAAALPATVQVAAFDTAFHTTIAPAAATYAVPAAWTARYGLRRYGFHGLSHAYAARTGAAVAGLDLAATATVTAHLGAGASLAAVAGGRSADTTMGFTPLAGLVMATRSGTVDPGLLLWLLRNSDMGLGEVEDALEHHSGLAGMTGGDGDMQALLVARDGGDSVAAAAIAVYVHRLAREAAAMTVSAGGLQLLVFTGGVGENAAAIRAEAAAALAPMGVELDAQANAEPNPADRVLSPPGSGVAVVRVTAREDLEVARGVEALLAGPPPPVGR